MIEEADGYVVVPLDEGTRDEANEAVRKAMEEFSVQPWYVTAYARIRFHIYWTSYVLRFQVASYLVRNHNFNQLKTFNRLGL